MVKGNLHKCCEAVLDSPASNAASCMCAMELRNERGVEAVMGSGRNTKMEDVK